MDVVDPLPKKSSTGAVEQFESFIPEDGLEAKLQAFRAALIEGETSGASQPFNFEAFIAGKFKRARAVE